MHHHTTAPARQGLRHPLRQHGQHGPQHGPRRLLVASAMTLALVACGGGSGSTPGTPVTPPVATITLSGTAAIGLPLTGSVTVKDAKGVTKSVALGSNGSYSVDVTGMSAPLLLRAEGTVGGTRYVVHSASATADTSGTVNITPLTDLIVANVAGQVASRYFDNGNFSSLTRSELDAESAALKAKLLPVLLAMQVDAAVDLLRTPFTPLSSALDKALDVIRIRVDPATAKATITNLVNQLAIVDDLATKAAQEANAAPLPATGLGSAADDLVAIRKALTDVLGLFKTSLPSAGAVSALLASNFLQNGQTRSSFANNTAGASNLIGFTFADIQISGIDYAAAGGALARVSARVLTKEGLLQTDNEGVDWQVQRGTDGVWRWRGNQWLIDFGGGVHMVKNTNGCAATGYEFNLFDDSNPDAAAIAELRVTGPGLPADGMRYRRSTGNFSWVYSNGGANNPFFYRLASINCGGSLGAGIAEATIAAIPDNAVYTLAGFNAQGVQLALGPNTVQTKSLPKRAMTVAELQAATFPSVTLSADLGSWTGGALTISGSNANPARPVWVYLAYTLGSGQTNSNDQDVAVAANGSYSASLTVGTAGTTNITGREVRVASRDNLRRNMLTNMTR